MEGTANEHDLWMTKITSALRSFRAATQRKVNQSQTPQPDEGRSHGESTEHDRT
ncbi:MAG TPA: hypothetical protein VGL81_27545 [Polyangiaceae bacterium]|jgi:hypothetical protein